MDLRVFNARRALEATYGLALEAVTDSEVARALAEAAPTGADDFSDRVLLERLVDLLPIDESSLFRNELLWRWLEDKALPELFDACAREMKPVRLASLGCSGGQEAFSLAMLAVRMLTSRGTPASLASAFASIVGIDASSSRIRQARSGTVSAWSVQRSRREWIEGMVEEDLSRPGTFTVHPSVVALARFEQGNLLELVHDPDALAGFQVVFLQHVLVYFRPATAAQVLEQLVKSMQPGTLLVLAPVEAFLLEALEGVERVDYVGAVRIRQKGSRRAEARTELLNNFPVTPLQVDTAVRSAAWASPRKAADEHLREALALYQRGRYDEALREARASAYENPRSLHARMCVGQILLQVDPPRGRRVLEELAYELKGQTDGASITPSDDLTFGQLRRAVDLLLGGLP